MSDRLPSAAGIGIGTYYEQQQQQPQQQQHPSIMASAMAKPTMHFPSALQQRLHDYQPPSNGYETPRYHSAAAAAAAAAAVAATAAAGGNYGPAFSPYGPLHYGAPGGSSGGGGAVGASSPAYSQPYADQQLQQQPHSHYDSTYNGRLIGGGGAMGGFYGGRERYFPYPPHHAQQQQQQHRHTMRGIFTPAGQQLVPSSVLHYPPRGAAYQSQSQQQPHAQYAPHQYPPQSQLQPKLQQQQQQQQQRHPDSSLYARNESQLPQSGHMPQPQQLLPHYAQRSPYLQMQLNGARPPSPTPTPTPTPTPSPAPAASALTPVPSLSLSHNVRPASVGYNPYQLPQQQQQQQQQPAASPSGVGSHQSALHEAITAATHQQRQQQQQQQAQDQNQHQQLQKQHQQQQLVPMYTENRCNSSSSSSDLPNTSEQSFMNADCKDDARFECTRHTPSAIAPLAAAPIAHPHSASTVNSPTSSTAPPALGDCLTTSPPLISATGTDSGISSCSTRARSDSTQSTPVYSGEYPNSVGSSSGVSYHCADVKDFEELTKEKDEVVVGAQDAKTQRAMGNVHGDGDGCVTEVKQELCDDEDVAMKTKAEGEGDEENADADVASGAGGQAHQTEPNAIQGADNVVDAAARTPVPLQDDDRTSNAIASQLPDVSQTTHNSSQVDANGSECPNTTKPRDEASNISVSASGASMHIPTADERSATPLSPVDHPQQQHQQPLTLHRNAPNPVCAASPRDSSWPSFPDSPNSWTQQSASQQQQLQQSSPPVPVPPHNSPVDYAPSPTYPTAPATPATAPLSKSSAVPAATAAATAATTAALVGKKHKNRIMEGDLIPNKKSKRKSSSAEHASESEAREEIRDMTPLPGFQQAFGSTEIGRFFESFLLRPADGNVESVDAFDMEQQLQLQHQQQQQLQQQHQQQLQHHHQQQQQQQHHHAADYFGTVYGEGGYHQRPHPHAAYYNRHAYAPSYQHHHLWPHARPSPYDAYDYGASRSPAAGGVGGMAPFNFHYGSGYSAMRDMLSFERMGYSYGRLNGGYGGIRCNGY